MNPAGLAIMEADSPGQVIGKHLIEKIVNKPYYQAFRDLNQRVFRGEDGELTYEITGFKGTRRWLQTHATPLRDKKGKIWAALAITRDITQQKKAEDELRASEARFRALFEHSSDAVVLLDKTGRSYFAALPLNEFLEFVRNRCWAVAPWNGFTLMIACKHKKTTSMCSITPVETWRSRTACALKMVPGGSSKETSPIFWMIPTSASSSAIFGTSQRRCVPTKPFADQKKGSPKRFSPARFPSSSPPATKGVLVDVNDSALELSGYSREQVIGRTIDDLNLWANSEDRAAFEQMLKTSGQVKGTANNFPHPQRRDPAH
jgi:PAS domain-containing protein